MHAPTPNWLIWLYCNTYNRMSRTKDGARTTIRPLDIQWPYKHCIHDVDHHDYQKKNPQSYGIHGYFIFPKHHFKWFSSMGDKAVMKWKKSCIECIDFMRGINQPGCILWWPRPVSCHIINIFLSWIKITKCLKIFNNFNVLFFIPVVEAHSQAQQWFPVTVPRVELMETPPHWHAPICKLKVDW